PELNKVRWIRPANDLRRPGHAGQRTGAGVGARILGGKVLIEVDVTRNRQHDIAGGVDRLGGRTGRERGIDNDGDGPLDLFHFKIPIKRLEHCPDLRVRHSASILPAFPESGPPSVPNPDPDGRSSRWQRPPRSPQTACRTSDFAAMPPSPRPTCIRL